ncbi:NAD-dependent succinate-semialdehyde dehydrogenase [Novosphingobium sp.]|uniref:NAD-dependent succinate-semialdehyde dehydrogenase n=1 Tax=Novosphingobium sp. TaxID=1874826 RepID=UPI0022C3D5B7|nr:NAD-dependent succinate-semialdehyde dehydrogenase [Novosphingobium sp.]MCZ8019697.1 NAD-dependent succinate-semialdehyde dehydrogenase [Novosphingobium sp.]MCZ8035512.1 NAD-dependent succinate-semialdehyde dehydrogenase [Novosphingobium sp.]MCZ8050826.1 NAD-dependent succinate-semialdehyde dehydrogenase [Novosphingobium sp.]MCZ8059172.1 NAD-dependent succinate-semialdehyde dehydrogenase [Novosphingobium sp.]MCZ8232618.1 NAD-dependent succinate-semialdehyde dehydrogenase [Novosphingobium sp
MTQTYDADLALFINGSWKIGEGRDLFPVVDPARGETIAEVPLASPADLNEALAAAERGFALWKNTPAEQRAAVLTKAAALLRERADGIARLLTMEQGKPLAEARGEVMSSAGLFDWCAAEATRIYGRVLVRPTGQRALVTKQPVGPVAAFSPWNFPIYLLAKKLGPALATGCSVIAKPPEETPGCTGALVRCLLDAGLPADVVQLVHGVPDAVSRHLLASPVIRKVSFTGSVPVGKHLMRLAADGLKRVTMELGGHAPVLVFDDCDLEKTLDMVVPQKFRNAGQVCVSPTRFYVQQGIYDRFVEGFAARAGKVQTGHGLDGETQMGPLANVRRPAAIEALVEDARAKGARVMAGGSRGNAGFFFQPTLLADVPDSADIMSNEPFGPVAVAAPFTDLDDAIAKANRLPYGLAAFTFTEQMRRANLLGDALESGMVGINTFAISVPDSPFGGVKDSGFGSEGGIEGMESYLVTKAIHQA